MGRLNLRSFAWDLLPSFLGAALFVGALSGLGAIQAADDWALSRWFRWRGEDHPSPSPQVLVVSMRGDRGGHYRRSRQDLTALLEGLANLPSARRPRAVVVDVALFAPAESGGACPDGTPVGLGGPGACLSTIEERLLAAVRDLGVVVSPYTIAFSDHTFHDEALTLSALRPHSLARRPVSIRTAVGAALGHPSIAAPLLERVAGAGFGNLVPEERPGHLGLFRIPLLVELAPTLGDGAQDGLGDLLIAPPRLYPSLALAGAAVALCGAKGLTRCVEIADGEVVLKDAQGQVRAISAVDLEINYRPRFLLAPRTRREAVAAAGAAEFLALIPTPSGWMLRDIHEPSRCVGLATAQGLLEPQVVPPEPDDLGCDAPPLDLSGAALVVIDGLERPYVENPLGSPLLPGSVHAQVLSNLLSGDLLQRLSGWWSLALAALLVLVSVAVRSHFYRPPPRLIDRLKGAWGPRLLRARGFILTPEPWFALGWITVSGLALRLQSVWIPVAAPCAAMLGSVVGWRLSLPIALQRSSGRAAVMLERLRHKRAELLEVRGQLADAIEDGSHVRSERDKVTRSAEALYMEVERLRHEREATEAALLDSLAEEQERTSEILLDRGRLERTLTALQEEIESLEADAESLEAARQSAEAIILAGIDGVLEGDVTSLEVQLPSQEVIRSLGLTEESAQAIQAAITQARQSADGLLALRRRAASRAPTEDTLGRARDLQRAWQHSVAHGRRSLEAVSQVFANLDRLREASGGEGGASEDCRYLRELGIDTADPDYARSLRRAIERFAPRSTPIYIRGERGTGKTQLGTAIHRASGREGPFAVFNCAFEMANPQLIPAKLMGHWQGAFNDARTEKVGVLEQANGGTLLLDEVGELPPDVQAMLLSVVERGEVEPIGSPPKGRARTRRVNVRFLIATNRDLDAMVRDGRFRPDLHERLAKLHVLLRPPRDRPVDIPVLVRAILHATAEGKAPPRPVPEVRPEVMSVLMSWSWPGNVRQLGSFAESLAEEVWFRSSSWETAEVTLVDVRAVLQSTPSDPRRLSPGASPPPPNIDAAPPESDWAPPPQVRRKDDLEIFGRTRAKRLPLYRQHDFKWCEDQTLRLGVEFSNAPERPTSATFHYDTKRNTVDALLHTRGDAAQAAALICRGECPEERMEEIAQSCLLWFISLMGQSEALGVDLQPAGREEATAAPLLDAWLHKQLMEKRAERRALTLLRLTQRGEIPDPRSG